MDAFALLGNAKGGDAAALLAGNMTGRPAGNGTGASGKDGLAVGEGFLSVLLARMEESGTTAPVTPGKAGRNENAPMDALLTGSTALTFGESYGGIVGLLAPGAEAETLEAELAAMAGAKAGEETGNAEGMNGEGIDLAALLAVWRQANSEAGAGHNDAAAGETAGDEITQAQDNAALPGITGLFDQQNAQPGADDGAASGTAEQALTPEETASTGQNAGDTAAQAADIAVPALEGAPPETAPGTGSDTTAPVTGGEDPDGETILMADGPTIAQMQENQAAPAGPAAARSDATAPPAAATAGERPATAAGVTPTGQPAQPAANSANNAAPGTSADAGANNRAAQADGNAKAGPEEAARAGNAASEDGLTWRSETRPEARGMAEARPLNDPARALNSQSAQAWSVAPQTAGAVTAMTGSDGGMMSSFDGQPDPDIALEMLGAQGREIVKGQENSFRALVTAARGDAQAPAPTTVLAAVQIGKAAADGMRQISVSMDPAELGPLDVTLEFGRGGEVRAVVTAERADTLDMLQRDAKTLERALADAGLKTDSGSLSFRQGGAGNGAGNGPGDGAGGNTTAAGETGTGEAGDTLLVHEADTGGISSDGRVNITI